ncbi:hypothetical protein ACAG24_001195 [Mycobacterium sp. pW049]|uniref:hypothetical protein n=1 Tax=[Mycobacterium] bulgaricum TaxID=3238985 RepID=UPI00351B774B
MKPISVTPTHQSPLNPLARVAAVLRAWAAPKTPTPQEYWGSPDTSVGWWKAL